MYDPDKRAELLKEYEALLPKLKSPEMRARMIADGLDPEAELKEYADSVDALRAAAKDLDETQEQLLHTTANVADAEYELFKNLRQAIQMMREAEIFEPQLEEMEDYLKAWAERLPKEPEE
jgi:DNA repair ATPase RecN